MNSFDLMCQAANALSKFKKTHDATCILYISDGQVETGSIKDVTPSHPRCLIITKFQQHHGFTTTQWSTIGTALFNLYNKEKACQARQKH